MRQKAGRMRAVARSPLYKQARDVLAERLRHGDWHPGDRLPTEGVLAEELGVSLGTLRRAVELLVEEGALIRRQGAGTFAATLATVAEENRFQPFESLDGSTRFDYRRLVSLEESGLPAGSCGGSGDCGRRARDPPVEAHAQAHARRRPHRRVGRDLPSAGVLSGPHGRALFEKLQARRLDLQVLRARNGRGDHEPALRGALRVRGGRGGGTARGARSHAGAEVRAHLDGFGSLPVEYRIYRLDAENSQICFALP